MGDQHRFGAAEKRRVLGIVEEARARTGWTVRRILNRLGLAKSVDYEWRRREEGDILDDMVLEARASPHAVLEEEKQAVIAYALKHPREGSRRLAWMMVDEDVEYGSDVPADRGPLVLPGDGQREPVHGKGLQGAGEGFPAGAHPDPDLSPGVERKLEGFNRSTRDELGEAELGNLSRAGEIIGRWVDYCNGCRLHASLNYLPPAEYWAGEPRKRMEERKRKLEEGRVRREAINR